MSDSKSLDFASFQALLASENVLAHGGEIHGLLTGLICGGFAFEDDSYLSVCNDFFNNGEGLPVKIKTTVKQVFTEIWQAVLDDSYSFQLMLPDDDDAITERCNGLSSWVQGFNLGFGVKQSKTNKMSEEVTEIIKDFAEIANLSDEVEDDEATEQAYYEIAEYVRISALLCFSELGARPQESSTPNTIH